MQSAAQDLREFPICDPVSSAGVATLIPREGSPGHWETRLSSMPKRVRRYTWRPKHFAIKQMWPELLSRNTATVTESLPVQLLSPCSYATVMDSAAHPQTYFDISSGQPWLQDQPIRRAMDADLAAATSTLLSPIWCALTRAGLLSLNPA